MFEQMEEINKVRSEKNHKILKSFKTTSAQKCTSIHLLIFVTKMKADTLIKEAKQIMH